MQKNSRTASKFFLSLIVINMLISNPSKCTSKLEDEMGEPNTTYRSPTDQKKLETIDIERESSNLGLVSLYRDKDTSPIGILPDDNLILVFGFLKIEDLGMVSPVSNHWRELSSQPKLWRKVGLEHYGDYLTLDEFKETPKQKVIHHYLSVYVNTLDDLKRITKIIRCYNLNRYIFVTRGIFLRILLDHRFSIVNDIHSDDLLRLCNLGYLVERGYQDAIERKISNLTDRCISYGSSGYENEKNPIAARELNELLVERGDQKAINRKINGLTYGGSGYEKDPIAARELNDFLVERGDQMAIDRKVQGLTHGSCGYERNPIAARELNDRLVEGGDQDATDRKIKGLVDGWYGYEKCSIALRQLNDLLVEKGDKKAIERKFEGLKNGFFGYEKSFTALRELNELFVEVGDREAINRKISGLDWGKEGYEKNPIAARELNELLVERGDQKAINRKINGLTYGGSGYEKDPIAARELNDRLVERGDQKAIERKVEGLKEGKFGYEKNLVAACSILIEREDRIALRELIEKLISGNRSRYPITGDSRTTYVTYGQDPKAASEINDLLVEQGDQDAIERKFRGLTQKAYQGQPGELYGYEVNLDVAIEFACFYVDNGNIDIIARITRLVLCSVAVNNNTKKFLIEDKLIQRDHPIIRGIGHYFKMLGLKYGIFSYEKNSTEAIRYIKLHNIPY